MRNLRQRVYGSASLCPRANGLAVRAGCEPTGKRHDFDADVPRSNLAGGASDRAGALHRQLDPLGRGRNLDVHVFRYRGDLERLGARANFRAAPWRACWQSHLDCFRGSAILSGRGGGSVSRNDGARRFFHCELGAGHLPHSPRRSHGRRSRRAGHRRLPRFRSGHAPLRDYRDSQSSDRGRFDRAWTPQCAAK